MQTEQQLFGALQALDDYLGAQARLAAALKVRSGVGVLTR
jgi:hypothetical protein